MTNRLEFHTGEVRSLWEKLQKNWVISLVNKFVLLFFFSSMLLIFWRWRLLPPEVPLWYSRPWGGDQLALPIFLAILPLGSLLWYGINILLVFYVTSEYLIFTQTLFLSSLVVSLLSFITLIKIIFLVS